jgi:hypothetical protein
MLPIYLHNLHLGRGQALLQYTSLINLDCLLVLFQEEKMIKIVQKQIKLIQQNRASELQRLAHLRQIHESYQKVVSCNALQESGMG